MAAQKDVETCFNYCEKGSDKGYFSSNEMKWVNRVKSLAEKYPSECVILQDPSTNGGFIYAKMPTSWLHIRPPVKRELTEEQRLESAERLRKARESR